MQFDKENTALVIIDPQNDVLSEKGISWALVARASKKITRSSISTDSLPLQRIINSPYSSRLTISFLSIKPGSSAALSSTPCSMNGNSFGPIH